MAELFNKALGFTLRWEGGYVNHPSDPGGATNKGVTQATYNNWRRLGGLPPRSVADIETHEIAAIYRQIWELSGGRVGDAAPNTAIALFDLWVQSGNHGGNQLLQRALGDLRVDGIWGPLTQARLDHWLRTAGDTRTAVRIVSERVVFRGERVLQARSQQMFLLGWLRRDADLLRLVSGGLNG